MAYESMRRAASRAYGTRRRRCRRGDDVAEPSATARPRRPRRARGLRPRRESRHTSRASRRRRGGLRERRGDGVEGDGALRRGRGRRGLGPRPARGGWARPAGPRRRLARLESAAEPTAKPTAKPKAHRYAIDAKRRERPRREKNTKNHTQVLDIHGRQKQQKRTSTFFEFCRATSGVLLCTDVAARGLDIPEVNWIVQFDPPDDPREYVHRVGRTARGETGTGRALLFLAPAELGFLRWLRDARVALHEYEFDMSKVTNIQSALTKLVEKNYYLHRAARDAYRSYLLAYASHAHKDIFDVHSLDLQAVSESFGFAVPPRVDLNLSHRGDKKTRRNPKKGDRRKGQSGHAFSAANPYGKKSAGDARQFSY